MVQNQKVDVRVNTHNMAVTKFSVEATTDPNFSQAQLVSYFQKEEGKPETPSKLIKNAQRTT